MIFQSTLPTRGSDGDIEQITIVVLNISIHAPHEGERPGQGNSPRAERHISIHAPHEGERLILRPPRADYMQFQSTLPTRGSDKGPKPRRELKIIFQSTLPTRGSDSKYPRAAAFFTAISIHAPHEGERPRSQ